LAAIVYDISVNSSSVASQPGYLDVQFNPGQSPGAPPATATISQFVLGGGALGGPALLDGDVTGSLPGVVAFGNGSPFNAILQPLSSIGNSTSFRVSFDGDFLTAASSVDTAFSLALLDAAFNPLLSSDPTDGRLVVFDLGSHGAVTFSSFSTAISVNAVPEPSAWLLLVAGLGGIALSCRRASRR
jgi:hypothetical protein